jgi:hypothetical protein
VYLDRAWCPPNVGAIFVAARTAASPGSLLLDFPLKASIYQLYTSSPGSKLVRGRSASLFGTELWALYAYDLVLFLVRGIAPLLSRDYDER